MFDWFVLLFPCSGGVVSALLFVLRYCVHSLNPRSVSQSLEENEDTIAFQSSVIKSVNEFQRVAHDFPNAKIKNLPTNCKNCGAPLHGHICKFCDTEYN